MRKHLAIGALAALALVGCSKSESTTTAASSTTTTAPALSKADLISKADAICKADSEKINAMETPETPEQLQSSLDTLVSTYKAEVTQLKALGAPAEGAAEWNDMLTKFETAVTDLEKAVPAIAADPTKMDKNAAWAKELDEAGKAAKAFGLKECGSDTPGGSSSSSSSSSK